MLAFTPHLAMLAALLAVTILPASTIAAAVAEAEGFYPFESNGIYRNVIGGGKRQMFERDDKSLNNPLGVPGTIQLKSLAGGHATALVVQNFDNRGARAVLAEADGTNGTPMFLVQAQSTGTGSIPPDLNALPGVAVNIHVAQGFEFPTTDYYCVTGNLDTAHPNAPLTVERCSNSKEANAHKTQVFRYNKQTGVIQALRPNGSTPTNGAPTGPYRGRTLTFVPGVAKTEDGKDSSSSTANTATEAEAEAETGAHSGVSSSSA